MFLLNEHHDDDGDDDEVPVIFPYKRTSKVIVCTLH